MAQSDPEHTVAVLDDDIYILDAVQLLLQSEGWGVLTFHRGEDLLLALEMHTPSCIVLDPHLSGELNGEDVARGVVQSHSHIPIIGLTAHPNSSVAEGIMRQGADIMLTKPIGAEEIVAQIRKAIALRQAQAKPTR